MSRRPLEFAQRCRPVRDVPDLHAMEDAEYNRMLMAEERHWWYAALHDLVLRFVDAEAARQGRALTFLDAGCGTGRLCQLLAPRGDVTGCDIHPLAVEFTRRRAGAKVFGCDLVSGNLGDSRFDLITMMDVLYHRRIASELAVLRNLHRALRPGGALIIQVPAFEVLHGSHDAAVHTRRRYRRRQLVRMIESTGFVVEAATYRLCALFPPLLAWRLCSRVLMRGTGAPPPSDVASVPSRVVNSALLALLRLENRLIACGIRFPFGTSVFAVARK